MYSTFERVYYMKRVLYKGGIIIRIVQHLLSGLDGKADCWCSDWLLSGQKSGCESAD